MALINNLYIFVEDEKLARKVDSTSHPVEKGIEITDSIRNNPITLSLSGKIVDYQNLSAGEIASKIVQLQKNGSLINFSGRNVVSSLQIQSFNSTVTSGNSGGLDFDMELKEVRIAKSSYNPPPKSATVNLSVGSIVVFKGGSVYRSSDAKQVAATRGRSTCEITIISNASYSVHKYHLISTDGGKVYGWVDGNNIEGAGNAGTAKSTNGETQQVQNGSGSAVYYTVKKGDTVYNLVNKNYKNLGKTAQWVIDNNPSAFSRKGDAKTLQIGAKLLMGYK